MCGLGRSLCVTAHRAPEAESAGCHALALALGSAQVRDARGKTRCSSSRSLSLHTGLQQPSGRHDFPEVSYCTRAYSRWLGLFSSGLFTVNKAPVSFPRLGVRVLWLVLALLGAAKILDQKSQDFIGVKLVTV